MSLYACYKGNGGLCELDLTEPDFVSICMCVYTVGYEEQGHVMVTVFFSDFFWVLLNVSQC